jgi:hypothetical protein
LNPFTWRTQTDMSLVSITRTYSTKIYYAKIST